jgi:hypothetical protein
MEDNQTTENIQISSRDFLKIRLKKIHRTQTWLSKRLDVNGAYVSLFFTDNAYPELEPKIEKIISREEQKIIDRMKVNGNKKNG